MDFKVYSRLVKTITIGKHLPEAIYIHESQLTSIPEELITLLHKITDALKISKPEWNLVKFYKRDFKVSLLSYPDFETVSYPELKNSFTIDLQKLSVRKAEYGNSTNTPILHRKETFVNDHYPLIQTFKDITQEGEKIGLYENVRTIGFKENWLRLISQKGYYLNEEGRLKPKHGDIRGYISLHETDSEIHRHRTAIDRDKLSNPMQILARHSYLNLDYSVLDYGCGKGDDIRELEAHGLNVSGWDPVHNPEGTLINSDIVNLGFVLNVIEDRDERDETLRRAWGYADKLLIVSVMIAGESFIKQFTPFRDGVVTSRKTFQRYYSQCEFKAYIESVLNENAIAVGQGVFIAFKDKLEEQSFLLERQHINRDWLKRFHREHKTQQKVAPRDIIQKNSELFEDFWRTTLDLGRLPANDEFEFSSQIRRVAGSHSKALSLLLELHGQDLYESAKGARKDDLICYFALGLFEKRRPYKHSPEGLKRDIKAFFESHKEAIQQATAILFSVGNSELIEKSATAAYEKYACGAFVLGHSWTINKELVADLPPELRIYIGCATQLYGDLSRIQLIKIHFTSGKVSLMAYDDWEKEVPLLVERIKIKLREQGVDFFDYTGPFAPPPLENKHLYL